MKTWDGPFHEVYSPIAVQTANGLERKLIGSYPLCTATEASEALDAAVAAYNSGRGEWPTMGVAERIHCVEQFTGRMIEQKDIIVKLIMWEIGKSFADSVKEFDRTV
ncbi:succinic semialdehyde dehydrogenase [compost metagenome]